MRKFLLIFSGILFMTIASRSVVYSQQIFKTTNASVIPYLEYLPKDYKLNSAKYPVVIFLHGIGERGPNTTNVDILGASIRNVERNGPPLHIKNGQQFPFILISPQLKNNFGNWPSKYVMEVINYVKSYLRIDEKRIYLTGLSLGGGGAWWTAQDYPELFAALAPVCGGRNTPSKACGIASENLPVWAFHGDKDTIVPLSRSTSMVNAINNCAPRPEAKMTIYPGVAHDSWTKAYKTDHSIHTPNVYEWMMSFTNSINAGNKLPTANAGADKTFSGTEFSLVGSGSDPDGNIAAYRWTQLSGPTTATLENKASPYLYASHLKPGEYVFSFRITDNGGGSDTDYIKVKVANKSNVNPVANAGGDKLVQLPVNVINLSGSVNDADGTIASLQWTKVSGPGCIMKNAAAATLNVSGLMSGTYVFRLSATNNGGQTSHDDVIVNVTFPPVVDAGADKAVNLPINSTVLTATASDADGTISLYKWSKYSGPSARLVQDETASLTITDLKEGTYVFMIEVSDNLTALATDYVTVTVKSALLSAFSPVADISKLKRISVETTEWEDAPAKRTQMILGNLSSRDLEDCLVSIFNGAGDRIFSGVWTLEKYTDIFSQGGLYLYHVIKDGKRKQTGKIYIRH